MLFTSFEFLGFLLVLFVLYYTIPKKFQWMLLLAASYIFYAFAGWWCLPFIAATTIGTYFTAGKIGKLHETQSAYIKENKKLLSKDEKKEYKSKMQKKRGVWLAVGLVFTIGILAVVKYTDFLIENVNSILGLFSGDLSISPLNILLPMGLSFYIFQTAGYLIDVWRGKYPPERNFFRLALFVSFFPQLIQGPISRYDDLSQTLYSEHKFESKTFSFGMQRILWGFFKKLVIADRLLPAVSVLIANPEQFQGGYVVAEMLLWAAVLYADFTGGIDITIGIAQSLGITLKENFDKPFFSKNIEEYWRRWHITMGSWFRDYLFYPLSLCSPMKSVTKWSKNKLGTGAAKRVPVYLTTIILWFATGLWHGASWNFIVWGLLNGVIIIISQELKPLYEKFHSKTKIGKTWWYTFFQIVRTFFLMSSLRLLDCYRDVQTCFKQFATIFYKFNPKIFFDGSLLKLGVSQADFIVALIAIALLIFVSTISRKESAREILARKPAVVRYGVIFVLFFVVLIFGAYGQGYDSSQFIYNQF